VGHPFFKDLFGLLDGLNLDFSRSLDDYHAGGGLLDFQIDLLLAGGEQEISQLLEVEFHHVASKLDLEVVHGLQNVEHLDDGSWCESWHGIRSLDRECLTGSSLSVCKDADVIAVNRTLDKTLGVVKDLFLGAVTAEDCIEGEVLGSAFQSNRDRHVIGDATAGL